MYHFLNAALLLFIEAPSTASAAPTEEVEGTVHAMEALVEDVGASFPAQAMGPQGHAQADSPEAWHDCSEELKERHGHSNSPKPAAGIDDGLESLDETRRRENQRDEGFPDLAEITGFGENAEAFAEEEGQ